LQSGLGQVEFDRAYRIQCRLDDKNLCLGRDDAQIIVGIITVKLNLIGHLLKINSLKNTALSFRHCGKKPKSGGQIDCKVGRNTLL